MKTKLQLGLILAIPILIFSYLIVKVPTIQIPEDYYTNSTDYSENKLPIVYEYYLSFSFVKINKCDVICPNERGFPFTISYQAEHDEFRLIGLIANSALSLMAGISLSSLILLVKDKRFRAKFN